MPTNRANTIQSSRHDGEGDTPFVRQRVVARNAHSSKIPHHTFTHTSRHDFDSRTASGWTHGINKSRNRRDCNRNCHSPWQSHLDRRPLPSARWHCEQPARKQRTAKRVNIVMWRSKSSPYPSPEDYSGLQFTKEQGRTGQCGTV